jgi:hypothetical protein
MNEYKYKLKDSVTDEMLDSLCAIRAKDYLLRKTAGYWIADSEYDFYSYDNELYYESENGYLVPESFVEETV